MLFLARMHELRKLEVQLGWAGACTCWYPVWQFPVRGIGAVEVVALMELVAAFHALGDNITLTWMSFLCLFEEFACLSSYRWLTSLSTRVMSACFCREEVVLDVWRS
jgi:hypothetical protein